MTVHKVSTRSQGQTKPSRAIPSPLSSPRHPPSSSQHNNEFELSSPVVTSKSSSGRSEAPSTTTPPASKPSSGRSEFAPIATVQSANSTTSKSSSGRSETPASNPVITTYFPSTTSKSSSGRSEVKNESSQSSNTAPPASPALSIDIPSSPRSSSTPPSSSPRSYAVPLISPRLASTSAQELVSSSDIQSSPRDPSSAVPSLSSLSAVKPTPVATPSSKAKSRPTTALPAVPQTPRSRESQRPTPNDSVSTPPPASPRTSMDSSKSESSRPSSLSSSNSSSSLLPLSTSSSSLQLSSSSSSLPLSSPSSPSISPSAPSSDQPSPSGPSLFFSFGSVLPSLSRESQSSGSPSLSRASSSGSVRTIDIDPASLPSMTQSFSQRIISTKDKIKGTVRAKPSASPSSYSISGPSNARAANQPAGERAKFGTTEGPALPPTVDPTTISYRDKIIYEVVGSERIYVDSLTSLIQHIVRPVKAAHHSGQPILPSPERDDIYGIFQNAEDLLKLNQQIYAQLQERLNNWKEGSLIGDIFVQWAPFLKMYQQYAMNYNRCLHAIDELEIKNSQFAALTKRWAEEESLGGLKLHDFLIKPIQRVPRYSLFINDLLKHTDNTHPDFDNLTKSAMKMQEVGNAINESIRQAQNRQKIITLQQSFVSFKGVESDTVGDDITTLLQPHRVYVRDGAVMKICRKSRKQRWIFLFNDILIYGSISNAVQSLVSGSIIPSTDNKYVLHGIMGITHLKVQDIPDQVDKKITNAFQLVGAKKSFVALAASPAEKGEWMSVITKTAQDWKERTQKKRDLLGEKENSIESAPVWIPDSDAPNCLRCNNPFGFFNRRHHCRACGQVVCADCSDKKVVIPSISKDQVRVCAQCFVTHMNGILK